MEGQPGNAIRTSTIPDLVLFTDTLEAVAAAAAAGCRLICFEPKSPAPCGCTGTVPPMIDQLTMAVDLLRTTGAKLVWKWPQITRHEFLGMAGDILATPLVEDLAGVMVDGIGAADALQEMAPTLQLYGGQGLNIWNRCAVNALAGFGLLTLSGELSREEIAELTDDVSRLPSGDHCPDLALIVQGSAGALVTEDCPVGTSCGCIPPHTGSWAVRDQKGEVFPLLFDGSCRTRIQNAVETCLIDHLLTIAGIGVTKVVIDARGRTPLYAEEMTRLYRQGLDLVAKGGRRSEEGLAHLKEEVKGISLGGITTGPFRHGLKET
jgi:putative protease